MVALFDTGLEASHAREWPTHLGATCDSELTGLWHALCTSFEDRKQSHIRRAWVDLESSGICQANVWLVRRRQALSVYVQDGGILKHLRLNQRAC